MLAPVSGSGTSPPAWSREQCTVAVAKSDSRRFIEKTLAVVAQTPQSLLSPRLSTRPEPQTYRTANHLVQRRHFPAAIASAEVSVALKGGFDIDPDVLEPPKREILLKQQQSPNLSAYFANSPPPPPTTGVRRLQSADAILCHWTAPVTAEQLQYNADSYRPKGRASMQARNDDLHSAQPWGIPGEAVPDLSRGPIPRAVKTAKCNTSSGTLEAGLSNLPLEECFDQQIRLPRRGLRGIQAVRSPAWVATGGAKDDVSLSGPSGQSPTRQILEMGVPKIIWMPRKKPNPSPPEKRVPHCTEGEVVTDVDRSILSDASGNMMNVRSRSKCVDFAVIAPYADATVTPRPPTPPRVKADVLMRGCASSPMRLRPSSRGRSASSESGDRRRTSFTSHSQFRGAMEELMSEQASRVQALKQELRDIRSHADVDKDGKLNIVADLEALFAVKMQSQSPDANTTAGDAHSRSSAISTPTFPSVISFVSNVLATSNSK